MAKRKKRRYASDVYPFVATRVGLSMGAEVLGKFSSPTATHAQQGLARMGSRMGTLGTAVGAKWVMGSLSELSDMTKKVKKKKR